MQTKQPAYFAATRSMKRTRDAEGVLIVELHTNSKPLIFTAQDHIDFVEDFYRIAQDRADKIVILTGTGGEFTGSSPRRLTFLRSATSPTQVFWSQVQDEGVQILENLANIRVPGIAAIEGRVNVHSEYALLASVIVAGEGATFHDLPRFAEASCRATVEIPGRVRTSGGVLAKSSATDCAHRSRMGSGC
jgi:enoyl-CoA hydratase/carnithine racemase